MAEKGSKPQLKNENCEGIKQRSVDYVTGRKASIPVHWMK